MHETTLSVRSGEHTVVGTLATPDGPGPFPAALVVPGSGPVDRDSNHTRMPLDVTRQVAHALTRAGVATFRYDKRGVGGSSGRWLEAGLGDNIADATAALEALRSAPAVDGDRVLVVGHSEGALIAGALAATTPVAGVVLLSASATRGEELLRWQARQIAPTLPRPVRLLLRLMRTDLEAKVAKNHAKIKATTTDVARVDGARLNARWTREFMAYDPGDDLRRLTAPVLAITGSKDLQTKPSDVDVIARLVQGPAETHVVPDVNHILRAQSGAPSLAYRKQLGDPVDVRVLDAVVTWARRQVLAPA